LLFLVYQVPAEQDPLLAPPPDVPGPAPQLNVSVPLLFESVNASLSDGDTATT
jgi:hypothetical protein